MQTITTTHTSKLLSEIAPHMFQHALHMARTHIHAHDCTPYEVIVLCPALQLAQSTS